MKRRRWKTLCVSLTAVVSLAVVSSVHGQVERELFLISYPNGKSPSTATPVIGTLPSSKPLLLVAWFPEGLTLWIGNEWGHGRHRSDRLG